MRAAINAPLYRPGDLRFLMHLVQCVAPNALSVGPRGERSCWKCHLPDLPCRRHRPRVHRCWRHGAGTCGSDYFSAASTTN